MLEAGTAPLEGMTLLTDVTKLRPSPDCISGDSGSGNLTYSSPSAAADEQRFSLSGFLPPSACQEEVYNESAKDIVDGVLEGYNGTVMAYGQTGSGKTHTIRGGEGMQAGVIPRALEQIFASLREKNAECSVQISYLQLYCEILQDLLAPGSCSLSMRERPGGEVFVEGLSRHSVASVAEAMRLLNSGDELRVTASTKLNAHSSRSHAAVLIYVKQRTGEGNQALCSTLVVLDLAGSERAKKSGAVHQRMEELKCINLSLSVLGNCVSALAQGRPHVPFRDSKLTRLLQSSLGGNTLTSLVVTLPPGADDNGEIKSVLRFAQRAVSVKVEATVNLDVDHERTCALLQQQLDTVGEERSQMAITLAGMEAQLITLRKKLETAEERVRCAENSLTEADNGYKASLAAMQDVSRSPAGERAVAAIESVNDKWRVELAALRETHAQKEASMRRESDRVAAAYKAAASSAEQEWATADFELSKEREGHLETLRELKKAHAQLRQQDSETSDRIAELLAELKERDDRNEALGHELQKAQVVGSEALHRAEMLEKRLEAMEERKERDSTGGSVSRQQVEAMEVLFAETVERLSTRVSQLEGGNDNNHRRSGTSTSGQGRLAEPTARSSLSRRPGLPRRTLLL